MALYEELQDTWLPAADTGLAGSDEFCCVCEIEFADGDQVIENKFGDIVCGKECQQDYNDRQAEQRRVVEEID